VNIPIKNSNARIKETKDSNDSTVAQAQS
jgi:hypothetical protein